MIDPTKINRSSDLVTLASHSFMIKQAADRLRRCAKELRVLTAHPNGITQTQADYISDQIQTIDSVCRALLLKFPIYPLRRDRCLYAEREYSGHEYAYRRCAKHKDHSGNHELSNWDLEK